MLSKEEFFCYVENHILEYVKNPEGKEVRIQKVCKNNHVSMTGVSIGTSEERLQPVMYLETFYRMYIKGRDLGEVLCEIGAAYQEYEDGFPLEEEKIFDYGFIRKNLFFRLVNLDQNQEQLEQCPYEQVNDLAVTYRWSAYRNSGGMASALIRKRDLELWGVSEEQMKADAQENTRKMFPPSIKKIESIIPVQIEEGDIPIFVLSNGDYMNGASAMLYDEVLKEFAERMKSNLYILPSSIHEVILLLEDDAGNPEELSKMVKDTNRTVVDKEEVLSDHVYYYDRKEDQITIAN